MDGTVTIATMIDTKDFDAQITYIENQMLEIEDKIKQADMGFEVGDVLKLEKDYEKLGNQLVDLKQKQEKYNDAIKKASLSGISNIQEQIKGIGNSIEGVTKKVVKWGLAIFGIRSAYMFIRQSMSTLSQYNENIATDIEYIRYALANTLKPVIEGIIQLVYKLLAYIGYIAKAWFGVNLFANASAKAFEKQKAAIGGSAKKAKELQKTLAGFDEMNIVQDSGDTSPGGGGGGAALPSVDLGDMGNVEIPGWIKWIADNKDIVIAGLLGIAAGLLAVKLGASALMGLGIGLIVAGILLLIQDIVKFINDPSWANFANILRDVSMILAGIALVMIAIKAASPVGWILLAVAAVTLLASTIIKHWDKIKAVLSKVGSWIYDNIISPVVDFFSGLWDTIKTIFSPVIDFFSEIFSTVYNNVKAILHNMLEIFKFLWDGIKEVFSVVGTFFSNVFSKAVSTIKSIFNPIVNFFAGIWDKVSGKLKAFGAKVGEVIGGAFKGVVNGVLGAIEKMLNAPIKAINGLIKTINKVPGIDLSKLDTFNFPRLAKGGIVNLPGRGVPIGGALTGEVNQEGVIPLTDSQQMALLGEAIGKYININATIPVYVGNRQIARELQKINAENDFAYNR